MEEFLKTLFATTEFSAVSCSALNQKCTASKLCVRVELGLWTVSWCFDLEFSFQSSESPTVI